ncbi:PIN domain-containing protein [Tsukamurella pseudospumae]|uniref:Ribonuclease VapC n=1 Tax=Tsukamurella pseudospumae TaxID=239498 RepID=A0A137ZZR7_9ACTN|nr:PIN domain-containing protein [Tsukamurella pseudospumae]KXO89200.1 hypothetical protein AXK61_11370 [Tsukamurella pseudospumae]KXP03691.1 hypothetical protein AXK60_17985 [Tsukamurella pseudospumae]
MTATLEGALLTPCLLDNSVIARIPTGEVPVESVVRFTQRGHFLAACTPQVLEALFSARSPREWDKEYHARWSLLEVLHPNDRTHPLALDLQRRLWISGKVRAAGPVDTMIAAIAIQHGAIVVHRDSDYERIAEVAPEFRQVRV